MVSPGLFFLLVVLPDPRFEFQEVLFVCLCHFSDKTVGNGLSEVMVREGVYALVVDKKKCPVCGIHKLKVASVWPFELFEVDLNPFNL